MHGISLKSFIVGNILSWLFLFTSLVVLFGIAIIPRPAGVTFDQALQQLPSSALIMSLSAVLVISTSALAGYFAAGIATQNLLLNGALAATSMMALKAYRLTQPEDHLSIFHGTTISLLGWGIPLFALSGAYLRKLQRAGRFDTIEAASKRFMSSIFGQFTRELGAKATDGPASSVSGLARPRRWKWILAVGIVFSVGFVAGGFLLTVAVMEREFFVPCPPVFAIASADDYAPAHGSGVFSARVLSHPMSMPRAAILARVRGTPSLLLRIEANGRVSQTHLIHSSGFCPFDIEALKDVTLWRFAPAYRLGTPVASWLLVNIEFGSPNAAPQLHLSGSGIDT